MSFAGKVQNGVVVLPPEAKLPDGTEVEVTPLVTAQQAGDFTDRLVRIAEFKRKQAAPVLKVTSRAFGTRWRMPIVRQE